MYRPTIVFVISATRITSTVLAIAIVALAAASRPAVVAAGHGHSAHGCQAATPGSRAATIEAADIAGAVHHAASASGISSLTGGLSRPTTRGRPALAVFTFARPHDPRHLHAFSLLI